MPTNETLTNAKIPIDDRGFSMSAYLKLYAAVVPAFFAIDMLWLGVIANDFYRRRLHHRTQPFPRLIALSGPTDRALSRSSRLASKVPYGRQFAATTDVCRPACRRSVRYLAVDVLAFGPRQFRRPAPLDGTSFRRPV